MALSLLDTKVIINEKPEGKQSWDPHGVEGYYLELDMEHYRCHTVYMNKTWGKNIADTVEFPPEHNKTPGISNQESATNAVLYMI